MYLKCESTKLFTLSARGLENKLKASLVKNLPPQTGDKAALNFQWIF